MFHNLFIFYEIITLLGFMIVLSSHPEQRMIILVKCTHIETLACGGKRTAISSTIGEITIEHLFFSLTQKP